MAAVREKAGDRATLRAYHFLKDNQRAIDEAAALEAGDFDKFLSLVKESGYSSFMYLQNVYVSGSVQHQEVAYTLAACEAALAGKGAYRVHGGGFAGTIQAFVPQEKMCIRDREGEMGHQDTILRSDYVLQTIEDGGVKLQKLDAETADWMRSRADAIMEQWIAEMGDEIELVLCNNDDMALGAADALKRKNSTAVVFGIDGTPAGLEALEQKVLWATVDCGAKEQGKAVFGIASALGMGKELPEDMELSDGRYVRVPVQARIHESIFLSLIHI